MELKLKMPLSYTRSNFLQIQLIDVQYINLPSWDWIIIKLCALWEFFYEAAYLSGSLLANGRISGEANLAVPLAFSLCCFFFGFVFVILEFCIKNIRHKSILQLGNDSAIRYILLISVPLTASIVGLLGFFLDLLQSSRAASIAVGIAWPAFLTAFFNTREADFEDEAAGEDADQDAESI